VIVDVLVADAADDQGLALARGYLLAPDGRGGPSLDVQITQVSDVMNLDTVVGAAHLAGVGEQAFDDFAASAVPYLFRVVVEVADPDLACQGDPAPLRHQWFGELTTKKLQRGTHRSVRAQRRHSQLDQHLERQPPPLRLDQDRRPDPRQHRPLLRTN
jgi:hypothetical protein